MKNTALTILTGLALATAAQAGSDYSAKSMPVAPPAPSCLWTWFAGGSGGYVSGDWDEEIYTLHIGAERKCPGSDCSHALYLEVGFTEKEDSFDAFIGDFLREFKFECEVIPITLNYKYECNLTGNLNWYVGAGAGVALVDCKQSLTTFTQGGSIRQSQSEDDVVFYAHIFAGLTYNVSESFEVFGGVRYIFMDDPELGGGTLSDDYTLDEDVHFELGARFNF
ncbi:hypothetical protein NT6N_29050 [Oceaniferula spumae]|uniref:Outer membrane protein beta-barrel domain-containing protein n=1 Tax=Oceaniferula spumae TaxID=2979115 RepID=A0AAT9FPK6_9BACT